jgi:hypothetical protein
MYFTIILKIPNILVHFILWMHQFPKISLSVVGLFQKKNILRRAM